MTDNNKPKLMIHRYPEKNEITLDDGNRYMTLPCSADVMEPCCRMLEEVFNAPYAHFDPADLSAPTDMTRPILYRETVAESRETLPDDAERLYASAEELKDTVCVLILMELSPDIDHTLVEKAYNSVYDSLDSRTNIFWTSTFTPDASYRLSLIGIF